MTDLFKDISVDEITSGLFVGNMACAESERALRQLKITAVVSVVSKHRRPFPRPNTPSGLVERRQHPLEKLFHVEDRIVMFVDDTRSENIFRHFEGACEFIEHRLVRQAGARGRGGSDSNACGERRESSSAYRDHTVNKSGRVLVHCTFGISRSVSIAAAYIMWKRGFSASRALQHVQRKRSMASPNEGFIDQLLVWEELKCSPWLSRRLHIRPRAYYDMMDRLEHHRRACEVRKALERAAEDKVARGRCSFHEKQHKGQVRSMERDTVRFSTRARR